jgi:hypothetical protein
LLLWNRRIASSQRADFADFGSNEIQVRITS